MYKGFRTSQKHFCLPYVCEDVNAFLQHFYEINGILQKDMLCFVST